MANKYGEFMHLGEQDLAKPQRQGVFEGSDHQDGSQYPLEERIGPQGQSQTGVTALLHHLHSKITGFESERVSWLAKFEAARLSLSSRATAVRSLRELNTELMDLGRAVSECTVQTWEAKLQRMELQRENKDLEHHQSASQNQRTQELATVFEEGEVKQVVDLRKGQKPQKVTKFSMLDTNTKAGKNNDLSLKQNKVGPGSKRQPGRFEAMTEPEKQIKAMYKTVVIPRDPGLRDQLDDSLDNHVNLAVGRP
jgi:hypothetical protein